MKIVVTGGAGFIGSALIRHLISSTGHDVVNIDKLTYAANLDALSSVSQSDRYSFEQIDIADGKALKAIFDKYQPDAVMHLAAETHVDRSILAPVQFIQTNVVGTFCLLTAVLEYWREMLPERRDRFRFHHISTDEVFGDMADTSETSTELSAYLPSSPYAASKASADHLVRAWSRTYGLPVVITFCSNNYGPWQNEEKFIPRMIYNALAGERLPVFGDGQQIRDWLFVEDHVRALVSVLETGKLGESYCISGDNGIRNIELVACLCDIIAEFKPGNYSTLISHTDDRLGHDRRYALDSSKIRSELGWKPIESVETGLHRTVGWYIARYEKISTR